MMSRLFHPHGRVAEDRQLKAVARPCPNEVDNTGGLIA